MERRESNIVIVKQIEIETCLGDPVQVGCHGSHKHLAIAKLIILNASIDAVLLIGKLTYQRTKLSQSKINRMS